MVMSNNITLRPLEKKDAPLMLEWMKDFEVNRFFRFNPDDITIDSVNEFVENSKDNSKNMHFAIVDKTDKYLGTVSLKNIDSKAKNAEYAIVLSKKAQGKGAGYSATKQILDYAFKTLALERVCLNVLSNNKPAINFYKNFGFIYEGEFSNHIFVNNELCSLKWFRIMKNEFESIIENKTKTIEDVKMLEFPQLGDDRGRLVVIEGGQNVPFEIKRIFYIYGSDANVIRGQHANRRSEFCLINVCGTSKVKAIDCKGNEKIFNLDRPHIGIYLPTMIWKDMYDFSEDSVLLVLSNEHYDGSEYVRNLSIFLNETT